MVVRTLFVLLAALYAGQAFAQVDISGDWASRVHEDQPHRAPGAELGDYTGLPINDAARQKASHWDASILALPERMAQPHPGVYFMRGPGPQHARHQAVRPGLAPARRLHARGRVRARRPHHLDGRPAAPVAERRAHLGRVLDRQGRWATS